MIKIFTYLINIFRPFRYKTNIKCRACGNVQKQPINWIYDFRANCQHGCDNTIFIDGSGQSDT